ncbi:MAG: hypothetical protein R6X29_10555 [Acidimicrobiia bacterium]|jgi:hypothetical protein
MKAPTALRTLLAMVLTLVPAGGDSIPVAVSSPTGSEPVVAMPVNPLALSLQPVLTVRGGTAEQLERLDLAIERFRRAGLELPDLEIVFTQGPDECRGHMGLFSSRATPWRVTICSPLGFVYEHELAHAWERATMTEEERDAFVARFGYAGWSAPDVPREERGIEGVAIAIQQALAGLPLPPVLHPATVARLEAFELLTDRPAPRLAEWIGARQVDCHERPTPLSRVLPDRTGRSCSP